MDKHADRQEPRAKSEQALVSRPRGRALLIIASTAVGIYICFRLLYPFIPSLTWALAFAIVGNGMYDWILARIRRPSIASGMAVVIIGVGIIGPSIFVGQSLIAETTRGVTALREHTQSEQWKATVEQHPQLAGAVNRVQRYIDIRGLAERAANLLGAGLSALVGESIWILAQLLITLFTLFYLFRDRDRILSALRSLLPLSPSETDELFTGVQDTINATIYGTVAVGILQGILGGLMFWWLDLPGPVLWGAVMALLALIPLLGAPVIWVPAAIYLAFSGNWVEALILTLWGIIVIGVIDNMIYPILVGDRMRMHTLLIFLSVVGGLFLFGSSGLLLGPLAVVVTSILLEISRQRTVR
jgi:predicted PurR-regulated permease PerM